MISVQRSISALLSGSVRAALSRAFPAAPADLRVPPVQRGRESATACDYRSAVAMAVAKPLGVRPADVLTPLCAQLAQDATLHAMQATTSLDGVGGVLLTLGDAWLAREITEVAAHGLLPPPPGPPQRQERVLVDYGSPNMGKELHPGHLRSAVVGDSLASCFEALGCDVARVSHVGDAGVPVAIVMAWYLQHKRARRGGGGGDAAASSHSHSHSSKYVPPWLGDSATRADIEGGLYALPTPRALSDAYTMGKRVMQQEEIALGKSSSQREERGATLDDAARLPGRRHATQEEAATASHNRPRQAPQEEAAAAGGTTPAAAAATPTAPFSEFVHATLRQLQAVLAAHQRAATAAPRAAATNAADLMRALDADASAAGPSAPADVYRAWVAVCAASRRGYQPLLAALGVHHTLREVGESEYVHLLPALVAELLAAGVAQRTRGAVGIFLDGPDAPPLLIQKGDGVYLYATVDLAALRARLAAGYDRVVYVTDHAQTSHFRALFAAARACGWVSPSGGNLLHPTRPGAPVRLEHAAFGVVTGASGKKLSSRDGTDATLAQLLAGAREAAARTTVEREAERRLAGAPGGGACAAAGEPSAPLSGDKPSDDGALAAAAAPLPPDSELAAAIAHSAVRYFDLSHAAPSNYRLSFDAALSFKGNTAAYLMYALARLASIRRQAAKLLAVELAAAPARNDDGGGDDDAPSWAAIIAAMQAQAQAQTGAGGVGGEAAPPSPLTHAGERALCLAVLRLPDAVHAAIGGLSPNSLAEQMFATASDFHSFHHSCQVLPVLAPGGSGEGEAGAGGATALSTTLLRLRICAATDQALRLGCRLLGVRIIQRM